MLFNILSLTVLKERGGFAFLVGLWERQICELDIDYRLVPEQLAS